MLFVGKSADLSLKAMKLIFSDVQRKLLSKEQFPRSLRKKVHLKASFVQMAEIE